MAELTVSSVQLIVMDAVNAMEARVEEAIIAGARARDPGQQAAQGAQLSTIVGTVGTVFDTYAEVTFDGSDTAIAATYLAAVNPGDRVLVMLQPPAQAFVMGALNAAGGGGVIPPGGPFLPLAGGTVTGDVTFSATASLFVNKTVVVGDVANLATDQSPTGFSVATYDTVNGSATITAAAPTVFTAAHVGRGLVENGTAYFPPGTYIVSVNVGANTAVLSNVANTTHAGAIGWLGWFGGAGTKSLASYKLRSSGHFIGHQSNVVSGAPATDPFVASAWRLQVTHTWDDDPDVNAASPIPGPAGLLQIDGTIAIGPNAPTKDAFGGPGFNWSRQFTNFDGSNANPGGYIAGYTTSDIYTARNGVHSASWLLTHVTNAITIPGTGGTTLVGQWIPFSNEDLASLHNAFFGTAVANETGLYNSYWATPLRLNTGAVVDTIVGFDYGTVNQRSVTNCVLNAASANIQATDGSGNPVYAFSQDDVGMVLSTSLSGALWHSFVRSVSTDGPFGLSGSTITLNRPAGVTITGTLGLQTDWRTPPNVKRSVTITTNGTTAIVATAGTFSKNDEGEIIADAGYTNLAPGTTIATYVDATHATLSAAALTSAAGVAAKIGVVRRHRAARLAGPISMYPTGSSAISSNATFGSARGQIIFTAIPDFLFAAGMYVMDFPSAQPGVLASWTATTRYRQAGWSLNTNAPFTTGGVYENDPAYTVALGHIVTGLYAGSTIRANGKFGITTSGGEDFSGQTTVDATTRTITASTVSGSKVITFTGGALTSSDQGAMVSGTGITNGTTIATWNTSGTTATLSANATATGSITLTIATGSITHTHTTSRSSFVVNVGATVPNRYGFQYFDATGTGLLQKQTAITVPYLTAAQTNIGLSLGSVFGTPAPATRTVANGSKITPDAAFIVIKSTGTSQITLGSSTVPAMAPGVIDGQRVRVLNTTGNAIVWTAGRGVKTGVVQQQWALVDWQWSDAAGTWLVPLGASSSSGGAIAAVPPGSAWSPNGFLSSTGTYTIAPSGTFAIGGPFVNFSPYLRYTGDSSLGSHFVVNNNSVISNDPSSAGLTLRNSSTVNDTQTIRSDSQAGTIGSGGSIGVLGHYTVRSSIVIDAIGTGATFATLQDVFAGYSKLTARTAAGNRYGWYFDATTCDPATTVNNLNVISAAPQVGFVNGLMGVQAANGNFGGTDIGQPIIDAAGVIPTTTCNAVVNLASAAFLAGTGVLTLSATTASLGIPNSAGVVAVFNYPSASAAVAGTTAYIAYISFTGTSGSTLTGCKNLSAQNASGAGTFSTTTGVGTASIIAYTTVVLPSTVGDFATISTNVASRSVSTIDYIGLNAGVTPCVVRTTGAAWTAADIGGVIDDGNVNVLPNSIVTGIVTSNTANDAAQISTVSTPFFTPPCTVTVYAGAVGTNVLVVRAPQTTPAGTLPQQLGYWSANLGTVASGHNIAFGWDDGSGTMPATNAFYGIWSPVFNVNATTGDITTVGRLLGATNIFRTDATDVTWTATGFTPQWLKAYGATPQLILGRAQGTSGSPTALTSGLDIFTLSWGGYDGTSWIGGAAYIKASTTQVWQHSGPAQSATRIVIGTTPNGSQTAALRAVFDQDGTFGVGTSTVGTSDPFNVTAAGDVTANSLILATALAVAQGGIGVATLLNHGVLLGAGTGAVTAVALDASTTKYLQSGGASAGPVWAAVQASDIGAGALTLQNNLLLKRVPKTGTYTVATTDCVVECTANSFTVTFSTTNVAGELKIISNSGAGTITVAAGAGKTNNGAASVATKTSARYVGDGSGNWAAA